MSTVKLFARDLVASFRGIYMLAHVAAIGATAVLVLSGLDWWYFEHTRNGLMQYAAIFAGPLGFFVPILIPLIMLLGAVLKRNDTVRKNAWIVAEAEMIAWLITSTYKIFTGRTQPEFWTHFGTTDISHDFHFGMWQHGIFWGWPSSHAAVALAMALALVTLYPLSKKVRYSVLIYALYIAIGASISFHWLSDAVAGALIGTAIGRTVAKERKHIQT